MIGKEGLRPPRPGSVARRVVNLALVPLLIVGAAGAALAQQIVGTLLDEATGAPVPQAVLVALGEAGDPLAGTLTDDAGAFTLRLPVPGRYRLRAERIGYRSVTSPPLTVGLAGIDGYRMSVATEPVSLLGINALSGRQCALEPEQGIELQRVWEEAQKALGATALTQREELVRYDLARYVRYLNPATLTVRSEQSDVLRRSTDRPFRSVEPRRLVSDGFVEVRSDSIVFHAPDAEVLLSREFRDTHCFSVVAGGGEEAGMVGLAFEPVRGRTVPDVAGVLWLDAASAELRHLSYRYVELPWRIPTDRLGGRLEFRRLPNGAWVVERWWLRAPVIHVEQRRGWLLGQGRWEHSQARIHRLREEGGELRAFESRDWTPLHQRLGTVRGVVYDSTRSEPLADARVFLSGTQYAVETDPHGRFTLSGVPPGEFTVSFEHPRVDSLGLAPPQRAVSVGDSIATVDLALPSRDRLLVLLCGEPAGGGGSAALIGYVRNAENGIALGAARVAVGWGEDRPADTTDRDAVGPTARPAIGRRSAAAVSDVGGRFRICGLPAETDLHVEASYGRHSSGAFTLRLETGTLARYDLPVEMR